MYVSWLKGCDMWHRTYIYMTNIFTYAIYIYTYASYWWYNVCEVNTGIRKGLAKEGFRWFYPHSLPPQIFPPDLISPPGHLWKRLVLPPWKMMKNTRPRHEKSPLVATWKPFHNSKASARALGEFSMPTSPTQRRRVETFWGLCKLVDSI